MAITLNGIGDTLSKSASTVKSQAQTGSSLVSTGVKDTLVAVDGYGKTTAQVLSNTKNTILGKLAATKNYLLSTSIGDLGSINDALAQASAIKAEATSYVSQISASVGQTISTVKGVSDDVINTANSVMNEINTGVQSTFSAIDGTISQINSGTSILDANNLLSSVNRLVSIETQFNTLVDSLSATSLKASILQRASYLGLSNIITSVYQSDSSNTTLTSALGDSLEQALTSGNITLIKSMAENLGSTYVLQRAPTAIQLILQNYTFATTYTANDYDTLAKELIGVLDLIDPNWNSSGVAYLGKNLSIFRNISTKAKNILLTQSGYAYQITIANHFSAAEPVPLAKTQYSYIALA